MPQYINKAINPMKGTVGAPDMPDTRPQIESDKSKPLCEVSLVNQTYDVDLGWVYHMSRCYSTDKVPDYLYSRSTRSHSGIESFAADRPPEYVCIRTDMPKDRGGHLNEGDEVMVVCEDMPEFEGGYIIGEIFSYDFESRAAGLENNTQILLQPISE